MRWFLLFTKRNFKKLSFLLILLLIPTVTLLMSAISDRDSAVVRIGYCCDGSAKDSTMDVFEQLKNDRGIISFIRFDKISDGDKALSLGEIDTLWIFPESISESIDKYFSESREPVIKILHREDSTVSRLTEEKLFCTLYPYISYSLYSNHMTNMLPESKDLSEDELQHYYDYMGLNSDIVETVTVNGGSSVDGAGILLSPLRGILSVVIMLSGFAAAMYTLSDIKRGMYSAFSPKKRITLCFTASLSATMPTAIAVIIALLLSGIHDGIWELIRIFPFVTACTSLSVLVMGLFRTPERVGVVIPIFTVSALIFSPVFLDIGSKFPGGILPIYYYLCSSADTLHLITLVIYTAVSGILGAILIRR